MDRRAKLERKVPLKKRNPERRAKRFEQQFGSVAFVKWVNLQECIIPGCGGWPCEAAHVTSRGAGGTAEDVIPLCAAHHREQHTRGVETFAREHDVDLRALAEWTQTRWTLYQGKRL
jgi:hypothetical protein